MAVEHCVVNYCHLMVTFGFIHLLWSQGHATMLWNAAFFTTTARIGEKDLGLPEAHLRLQGLVCAIFQLEAFI